MIIKDGTGTGKQVKIDTNNRLHTYSVSIDEGKSSLAVGDAYNWNTGKITLTNAVDTPVIYLKNNENRDLLLDFIELAFKPDTGGSAADQVEITVLRNPTTGTIVSNAVDVAINQNRDFATSNTFTGNVYKGATGNTVTDGTDVLYLFSPTNSRLFLDLPVHLAKGDSIAVTVKPRASNTSMEIYCALVGHLQVEI